MLATDYKVVFGGVEYLFKKNDSLAVPKRVPIGEHRDPNGVDCLGREGLLNLDVRTSTFEGNEELFTGIVVICALCRANISF